MPAIKSIVTAAKSWIGFIPLLELGLAMVLSKPLTPKQEKFAQLVADGRTQADAYRIAYNCTKINESQIVNASKLMSNANISQRVRELKEKLSNKSLWTREESVQVLKEVIEEGRAGDKTSAVKELNLMHGYNAPIKHELSGSVQVVHRVVWE